ncbi:MAG: CRTAC1 family protein [Chloroflexota bacterium]
MPQPEIAMGHHRRTARLALGAAVLGLVAIGAALAAMALGGPAAPTEAMAPPRYVEEAAAAGIEHAYDGDFTFFVGGGVAVFDCDDDGRPELYLAGGASSAALYHNDSPAGGALRFTASPDPATDLTEVTGAYPIDINGDRRVDLAVLRFGENVLLRGLGDCRFERANETWGFDGGDEWTAAFSATWEGSASLPTLAFGNYLAMESLAGARDACAANVLVREGGVAGRYGPPSALSPGLCTLSILFSDWNRSGRRDLRMTNDRHYYREGEEQLWWIAPGEPPRLYGRADGWKKMQIWGMGIASQDLTGDGRPEVFLTSQGDNKLQALDDGATGPAYHDIALQLGATAHRPFTGGDILPSTAWHAEFEDVNNDGFTDLFISKGNVESMSEFAAKDPSNLLLGQPDGTFIEAAEAAGIVTFDRGRGAAVADLNLDGLLDIVEVTRRDNVKLWRNVGWGAAAAPTPMGHWVALRLQQPGPNGDAIGAWVEVRVGDHVVRREMSIGGGHASGQLGWASFGLGSADRAEVRVQWPDGESGPWLPVGADRFAIVERGAAAVIPWNPPQQPAP